MKASDEAMRKLCEAMIVEAGAGGDFQLELGRLIGKYRKIHEQNMREVQAANLLPHYGPDSTAERLGVCRRTVYNWNERARKKVQASA